MRATSRVSTGGTSKAGKPEESRAQLNTLEKLQPDSGAIESQIRDARRSSVRGPKDRNSEDEKSSDQKK